jgi:hypothetical protein
LVLVVGSQCDAANLELSVLPRAAHELAEVLVRPELGGCTPALPTGPTVIDPTAAELDDAIVASIRRAHDEQATLFLVFVGHGGFEDDDFYLLAKDSSAADSRQAVLVGQRVKELLRRYSNLDGLVMLIDACHSGLAAEAAGREWLAPMRRSRRRFELLTATDEGPAFGACLTRSLTRMIRTGVPAIGERLHCADLKTHVDDSCQYQVAVHLAYDGSREVLRSDAGLWLAVNAALAWRSSPLADTSAMAQVERLVEHYEPTRACDVVHELVRDGVRCVVVIGPAGSGKSATVATLVDPRRNVGVHASVFLTGATTAEQVAVELARQLGAHDLGLAEASARYWDEELPDRWPHVDALEVHVLGPLRHITERVRLVIDGTDTQDPITRDALLTSLARVTTEPELAHVQLVITGDKAGDHLPSAHVVTLDLPDAPALARYAELRGLSTHHVANVVTLSGGSWLSARLITDGLLATTISLSAAGPTPSEFDDVYRAYLRRAGLLRRDERADQLRAVLSVLLAAGIGPVLPFTVLLAAVRDSFGHGAVGPLRDLLLRLDAVVVRGRAGTPDEHVGIAERAFADFLRQDRDTAVDEQAGHRALASVAAEMPSDYAIATLHRHLWAVGQRAEAVEQVDAHESAIPLENRTRWATIAAAAGDELGARDVLTLRARARVATWTAKSGDPETALPVLREVLDQAVAVLGPQHVDVLSLRNNVAFWTGYTGDWPAAGRLFAELADECAAHLGPEHPETLSARHHVAVAAGKLLKVDKAMRGFHEVLELRDRVMGPDHIDTLRSRHNILYWEAETEHPPPVAHRWFRLVDDLVHSVGPDHPETLTARYHQALFTAKRGEVSAALAGFHALLPDCERVLGPWHPDTRQIMVQLDYWSGRPDERPR